MLILQGLIRLSPVISSTKYLGMNIADLQMHLVLLLEVTLLLYLKASHLTKAKTIDD